jgi:CO/xanthine dehydrogenase FAD-binding subunit
VSLHIPIARGAAVYGFERLPAHGAAAAACGAVFDIEGSPARIQQARLWVGCIGVHPHRISAAEQLLAGLPLTEVATAADHVQACVAKQAQADDGPTGSAEYRVHLAAVLAGRAVVNAAGEGGRTRG